jgi:hypothetical protein
MQRLEEVLTPGRHERHAGFVPNPDLISAIVAAWRENLPVLYHRDWLIGVGRQP